MINGRIPKPMFPVYDGEFVAMILHGVLVTAIHDQVPQPDISKLMVANAWQRFLLF